MKALKKLLGSRLFLAFIGLLFVSLFIWFVGPMLGYAGSAPLQGSYNRLIAIGSLSLLWLLMALVRFVRARKDNARMLDSLANEGPSAKETASAEELAILQQKMQDAVSTLKQRDFSANGDSRFLTDLPWYVIIGPPGAGKTTLLSHSGLDFPLEETHGKLSVKGLGGTRNCDWWFTDQAVLLDTAGRYTTQDSEAEVDRNAWIGFLTMLREKRRRRPLNGVLLALSIEDVLHADDATLEQIAHTLRARVEELYQHLGIAPPVYLMLTKCDLLAGFSEFFDDLDRQRRQQVWGHTLTLDDPQANESLMRGLESLQRRLHQQCLARLHAETGQRKRELIYGFPMQFNVARERVQRLLQRLTAESRLLQPILFRGVYFTSATQTGSVLDQLINNVSRHFGITDSAPAGISGEGRSFFIRQLLGEVIFAEAGLAGTNLQTERRLKRYQWSALAAMAVASVGMIMLWGVSFQQNRQWLNTVQRDAEQLQLAATSLDPSSPDLLETGQVLDQARSLAFPDEPSLRQQGALLRNTGLHPGERVTAVALSRYDALLQEALLPRLLARLEQQMHSRSTDNEFLFEALKTYQMIGLRDRFVADEVIGWSNVAIYLQLSIDVSAEERATLKRHVDRLFRQTPRRLPRALDESLIRQYQQIAVTTPLAQRAYGRIRRQAGETMQRFLPLSRLVDPELTRLFTRQDQRSLDQSLTRFHSVEGFHDYFLPESVRMSQSLADDAWVLGEDAQPLANNDALVTLQADLTALYHADYIAQWQHLFDNLRLRRAGNLNEVTRLISLLGDSDSPLKQFLVFASEQTTLIETENTSDENTAERDSTRRENELRATIFQPAPTVAEPPTALRSDPVAQHFAALHALVDGVESGTSSLDTVLSQLADLNIQLLPMAQAPAGTVDPALNRELALSIEMLALSNDRLAEPLASLVSDLTGQVSDVASGGFCQQLNSVWKAEVLPFYQRAIRNRYPLSRGATVEIALSDFGAFFGPGGVLDTFVNTYLHGLVQRTTGQWTWVGTGSAVCLSENSLRQFARAEDIRNTFFVHGGQMPSLSFDLMPKQLIADRGIEHLYMSIGSNGFEYIPTQVIGDYTFAWPPPNNNTQVHLRVEPALSGSTSGYSLNGPWAILQLFDLGSRVAQADGLKVTYNFGVDRSVTLVWRSRAYNPLDSVALRNFRAPEEL